jgi:hypothetical protein
MTGIFEVFELVEPWTALEKSFSVNISFDLRSALP